MDNVKAQKLRNLAFGKLKEDRSKFNGDEIFKIVELIKDYENKLTSLVCWSSVKFQIRKDIITCKKYDCFAMWFDWESGLVKYEPDLIEKIAREVGGLKIEEGELNEN